MKRFAYILVLTMLLPAGASGQQDPVLRLGEVLPADVADQVLEHIENARGSALPGEAVANLALEGVAKGRTGDEVLAAVASLVSDLGAARDAIEAAGRSPDAPEIQAAATAMSMGVDGGAISDLARSQVPGRSLSVPMMVMGALAQRGLPSDQALARVSALLAARADDQTLMNEVGPMGPGMAQGGMPAQMGPGLAGGMAGFQVPVSGINVPMGPHPGGHRPDDVPRGPGGNMLGTSTPPGPGGPGV